MYKRLKECKSLREIFEVIPEGFYEKCAMIISGALFLMVVFETIARYIVRSQTLDKMQSYFNIVGYMAIVFAVIHIMSICYKTTSGDRKEYFKTHIWDFCFILFLVMTIISACASGNFEEAYSGHWMRMFGLRTFVMTAGLYICGKNIKNTRYIKMLWWMFVTVSTVQGTLILTKYTGSFGSYCGAFYNRNHAGYFMCMAIMAAEAVMIYENKALVKVIAGILMGYNTWLLILNDTFGSYLGVLFAVLFMVIINIICKSGKRKLAVMAVGIFIIASIIGELNTGNVGRNFRVTGRDVSKIKNNSEDKESIGTGRGELWGECANAIKKSPVFGYGPDLLVYNIKSGSEPHNELLQIGAEEGGIALVLYVCAILSLFLNKIINIKSENESTLGTAGILAAYFVSGMFGVIFFYTAPFFYLMLGNISEKTE